MAQLTKSGITLLLFFCISVSIAQVPRLKVHSSNRILADETDKPFFYLGDTAWELLHRLSLPEVRDYFHDRKAKGFTVIQTVILPELDGLHTPNEYGYTPLINDDPTRPREEYFAYVDKVIQLADSMGLYIGLLPTWGDKVYRDSWGVGPEIFTSANARIYGEYLGTRYRNATNLIWILGGDRNPRNEQEVEIWRSMAAGIEKGVGGSDRALMTFHPQPTDNGGSSTWFHTDSWLDFNMHQTGHCKNGARYKKITADYERQPVKPVIDAEPLYEAHPVCFNADKFGHSTADDVRKLMYWQVLSGAAGHTYGCHAVWQMYDVHRAPVNKPLEPWQQSLSLPGSTQMGFARTILESYAFETRVPDQSLLKFKNELDSSYVVAARAADGSSVLVYTPTGRKLIIDTSVMKSKYIIRKWYNPRTGILGEGKKIRSKALLMFESPESGADIDWVLVLEGEGKG